MTVTSWLRSPRVRRGVALATVVLATGGLVLHRTPAGAFPGASAFGRASGALAQGKNSGAFAGPGAHGRVSLSHTALVAGRETAIFAEVRLVADEPASRAQARAPIALAVVLDTSGSMSGEKIQEARRAVLRLVDEMRDDDELTVVRYSDAAEVWLPLGRVGGVRSSLPALVGRLEAAGGTNIPSGLSAGLAALEGSTRDRVRRIVLVSDGLDSTRAQAESLARGSFQAGVTVSSLGIGLDFDESYMGSVAQSGHGNFAFVKDGAALASFLHRELEEASRTTVENARVRLSLPPGARFLSATGAEATVTGGDVELSIGSLYAGDERRIVVALVARPDGEGSLAVNTRASWTLVGGSSHTAAAPRLELGTTNSLAEVERGTDTGVLASATSVVTSQRQIEAASAYAAGDVARAAQLTRQNEAELAVAMRAAPAPIAASLGSQMKDYQDQREGFAKNAPGSAEGRAAAKESAAKELGNLNRVVR